MAAAAQPRESRPSYFTTQANTCIEKVNGTSTNGSFSYSSSMTSSSQINVQKVTVLREITSKVTASCRRELGSSSAQVLEDATEVGVIFDYIAAERLRCMPHSGSRYDKVLRWAEPFAAQIHSFSHAVSEFVMYSTEAAQLIWGGCLLLLQVQIFRLWCARGLTCLLAG
jgi:hypothetical protein